MGPGQVRLLGKGPAGRPLARGWFQGPAHPLPITHCGSQLPGRLQVAPALCSCSRRRGFERADSEYTDKLQHYTSGHSMYTPAGPAPRALTVSAQQPVQPSFTASTLAAVRPMPSGSQNVHLPLPLPEALSPLFTWVPPSPSGLIIYRPL